MRGFGRVAHWSGAAIAAVLVCAPALAQSERNASAASGQTSVAVGAIGESGLKASAGVVAIPLGVAGSGAMSGGAALSAAGAPLLGGSIAQTGSAAIKAADASSDFAGKPLTVSKDVVVGPAPQPAPNVPYAPVAATGGARPQ